MLKVLKNKNFSNLFYGALASEFGSFATDTALMLYIYEASGLQKSFLGLSRALFLLTYILGSFIGGPIGEGKNKKEILIACELLRIPFILILLFQPTLITALLCHSIVGFFSGIFSPTRQSYINELVPSDSIRSANSLFGSTYALLQTLCPFIGAYAFTVFGGVKEILYFDLLSYILAVVLFILIQKENTNEPTKRNSYISDISKMLEYLKSRDDLKVFYSNIFILGALIGTLIPLLLPHVKNFYGLGDTEYGILLSVFGIGGIIGGKITLNLGKHFNFGKIVVFAFYLELLLYLLWTNSPTYIISLALIFIWGVVVFVRISSQLNYISETIPQDLISRSHALLNISFILPNIVSGIIISAIGNNYPTTIIFKYASIILLPTAVLTFFHPGMRKLWNKVIP